MATPGMSLAHPDSTAFSPGSYLCTHHAASPNFPGEVYELTPCLETLCTSPHLGTVRAHQILILHEKEAAQEQSKRNPGQRAKSSSVERPQSSLGEPDGSPQGELGRPAVVGSWALACGWG